MRKSYIAATGLYHPEKLVPNSYFNELYKQDIDTFLREKRNIRQRYFMAPEQATSDLIIPAVEQALQKAAIKKDEVDLLIVATDTPDYLSPSTASVVQHKMGLVNAGTFDLNSACAGFVTALDVASKYIQSDEKYRNIVVVGAYGMTKYLNMDDYKIASLFADGAGAVVVKATEKDSDPGIMASKLFTLGEFYDYMGVYGGGTAKPITKESIDRKEHLLNFAKKIPLETNSVHWPRLVRLLLDRTDRKLEEVKHFFLTQINIGTIEAAMDALGVNRALSHNIMDRYGYTGSACIPMAIADAAAQHKLKKGDFLMLVGSGGGVAMGAMALEWAYDT
ncbi:MAG TPA: ketoacyl-ACP synthase III [Bdellovibrionota bacterium]|jgi:3-oxoacyl-[acyl-carrier-protein] synthase-3